MRDFIFIALLLLGVVLGMYAVVSYSPRNGGDGIASQRQAPEERGVQFR